MQTVNANCQNEVFISIGSNLGNPLENCKEAIGKIRGLKTIDEIRISSFYKTAPLGVVDQNWFVNCVVCLKTTLSPWSLLTQLLLIETEMGRIRTKRWAERVIDLDILLYNEQIVSDDDLTLPHPRMHERSFVLEPMVEIAPDRIHPVFKKRMFALLEEIEKQEVFKIE